MTTGKTIALTIETFVSKVMSLLFNRLSRFVVALLFWSRLLLFIYLFIFLIICRNICLLCYYCVLSCFSHVQLCEFMDCSLPAFIVKGLCSQQYWSGLPWPLEVDLPDPGMEPTSLVSCIGRWVL